MCIERGHAVVVPSWADNEIMREVSDNKLSVERWLDVCVLLQEQVLFAGVCLVAGVERERY